MAQYYYDFSNYTADAEPSGWTKRWSSISATYKVQNSSTPSGKELQAIITAGTIRKAFSLDVIDSDSNRANIEILVKFRIPSDVTGKTNMFICVHGSGGSGTENFYGLELRDLDNLYLWKRVSGTSTTLDSALSILTLTNTKNYWARLRVENSGVDIYGKIWEDGESEPDWQVEKTGDAGWSASLRFAGVGTYVGITSTYYDIISIATNGETARAGELPVLQTNDASNVGVTTARITGEITDANDDSCDRYIEFGTTTSYGTIKNCGSGANGSFYSDITGLSPNTTYHFRAYATNSYGTTYGSDKTFVTNTEYQAVNLNPDNNEVISPLVENTFTWAKNTTATQTHYLIEYKIIGAENYISTGAIESSNLYHTFDADTFDADKEYEWRVLSYDSAIPANYNYSEIATFSTINLPLITNKSLEQDDEVEVGVLTASATITSIYDRQCKLKILVSTSSDFAEYTEDEGSYKDSGEVHSLLVIIPYVGQWYIRYIAEDSEGLITTETISINAKRTIYFISEPKIELQSPQATHITVRVKNSDPVVEYTAYSTPEAGTNDMIERLVEIDSGTLGVCQSVAEQLIARWGREQKSISGDIDLTVTLNFKEKIHIIDGQSGIDAEFILQEKSHNVTEMITSITVGDIILDDSEMLARILDKLK